MSDDGFRRAKVFSERAQTHRVHQTNPSFHAALKFKGDQGTARSLLSLCQFELGEGLKTWIRYVSYLLMSFEKTGHV